MLVISPYDSGTNNIVIRDIADGPLLFTTLRFYGWGAGGNGGEGNAINGGGGAGVFVEGEVVLSALPTDCTLLQLIIPADGSGNEVIFWIGDGIDSSNGLRLTAGTDGGDEVGGVGGFVSQDDYTWITHSQNGRSGETGTAGVGGTGGRPFGPGGGYGGAGGVGSGNGEVGGVGAGGGGAGNGSGTGGLEGGAKIIVETTDMEGPRFDPVTEEPLHDAVGQPLVCADEATECCDPCTAFLACLLKRKFLFRSDGAPLINLLDKFTHQFVITSGTPDMTDAGEVQDLSVVEQEKMFCLSGSPAVLLGFGQYEHFDETRVRNIFDGSFILEPVLDSPADFDINDDGSDDVPGVCEETHLAKWPQLLYLIPDRTPCVDDFDPAFAGFGEGCGIRPRSMPVRLALRVTCTEGMLTFTMVLIYHRHYWVAEGDGIVDVETGDLADGIYGCPCITYYCLDWLTSDPIDLSTTTPADLVDIDMNIDLTPTDCFDAFYDTSPVATLTMIPATCDGIEDCNVCPPDEDPLTPLELVEIDFTYTARGDQPTEGAMAFLHAVIPDCLDVEEENILWSFGAEGTDVSHLMEVLCEESEADATFCEEVTLTVIDNRGCIYEVTKVIYSEACQCGPEADGQLSVDQIAVTEEGVSTWRFLANIFDCPTGFIEVQGGDGTADCGEVPNCDCLTMFDLETCRHVEGGFCVFALGDDAHFDHTHSQTADERECWRWRFWDGPCGCAGPWNYFEIVGTYEGNPDSRGCGDSYW